MSDSHTLTNEQLCERWQICRASLDRRIKAGDVPPPFKLGGLLRWRVEDIERYESELVEAAIAR